MGAFHLSLSFSKPRVRSLSQNIALAAFLRLRWDLNVCALLYHGEFLN